jgi:hypothetical protein
MAPVAPLAISPQLSSVNLARAEIEALVPKRLAGRKVNGVAFVEELLAIVTRVGEVQVSRAEERGLRVRLAGGEPFEVDLDFCRGKIRSLCARLAVLCQECGHDFMLYGGEGTISRTVYADSADSEIEPIAYFLTWKARWSNTPDKHEFTISVAR